MPVTFEASQSSASASMLIGTGRSGSITRNAWPCAGVRSNSAQMATHQSFVAKKNSTKVGQNTSALVAASSFTETIMSNNLKVDNIKYRRVRLWPSSNDQINENRGS